MNSLCPENHMILVHVQYNGATTDNDYKKCVKERPQWSQKTRV